MILSVFRNLANSFSSKVSAEKKLLFISVCLASVKRLRTHSNDENGENVRMFAEFSDKMEWKRRRWVFAVVVK